MGASAGVSGRGRGSGSAGGALRGSPRIAAKPTVWRGIPMRSALEARWAQHLDEIGVLWEYEPQPFFLGPKRVGYLPDFRLTRLDAWLEVKGGHLLGLEKTRALARQLGAKGLVIVGTGVGVAWRALPSGGASALEIGYGKCLCGQVAVGPMGARRGSRVSTGGALGIACRACGRSCWAQGVLGW